MQVDTTRHVFCPRSGDVCTVQRQQPLSGLTSPVATGALPCILYIRRIRTYTGPYVPPVVVPMDVHKMLCQMKLTVGLSVGCRQSSERRAKLSIRVFLDLFVHLARRRPTNSRMEGVCVCVCVRTAPSPLSGCSLGMRAHMHQRRRMRYNTHNVIHCLAEYVTCFFVPDLKPSPARDVQ